MGRRVTDSGIAPAASWRGPTALRGSDAPARRTVSTRLLNSPVSAIVAALATASFGASGAAAFAATPTAPGAASLPATGPGASPSSTAPAPLACLASGNNGYLRARLRGTFDLDLAWSSPTMQCEGGARPDGRGLRVTIAGPAADGRRLRFVFGIDDTPEGASVRARPTNLTVIFEGEQRLFATRGADKCTTDELRQERIGALGGPRRSWRIVARGFCIGPATTLAGDARLLLTSFDFASEVTHVDEPAPPAAAGSR